ncbi:MAG: UMP kinase [Elusimicrobiota bacterium]
MYKKIVLKLSGESLGKNGRGIDFTAVDKIIAELIPVYKKGVSVGIVIGGGNIWRGTVDGKFIDRTSADYIGITATLVNGMVLCERLKTKGILAKVFSPFAVGSFLPQFTVENIENAWKNKNVVIMVGGTGEPHFTTDTAAAVFAIKTKAEIILKATNVDGIYSDDPKKNPAAKLLKKITFDEVIKNNLKVMDTSAFSLCRQHGIKIVVFNFNKKESILKAVCGKKIGSVISS